MHPGYPVALCAALCFAASSVAQSDLPPEVIQLSRIKQQMNQHLTRIANLTCLQTIQRFRSDRTGRMQKSDMLRLEVAFVDGKELFSRPGASKFGDRDIGEFGRGGAIESGLFASLAHGVFLERPTTFRYGGEETLRGRRAVRYTYQVPLLASGYRISSGDRHAVVGFSGAFWADAETLQVMRLRVHADDVPLTLGIYEAIQTIDYARVRLNETDFLLPQQAEMSLSALYGQSHNRTEFTHWLRYETESTIVFGDAPSGAAKTDARIGLPPGLVLSTRLETEIRSENAGVGDRITATVDKEARWKGDLIVPAGATLVGRIRSIEKPDDGSFTLALEFAELQIGDRKARFFARLTDVTSASGARKLKDDGLPGVGTLQIRGDRFRLSRELHLIWKMGDL
jgi:hypothetical protein